MYSIHTVYSIPSTVEFILYTVYCILYRLYRIHFNIPGLRNIYYIVYTVSVIGRDKGYMVKQGKGNQCRTPGVKFLANTVLFWANTFFFSNTVVFWTNTVVGRSTQIYTVHRCVT